MSAEPLALKMLACPSAEELAGILTMQVSSLRFLKVNMRSYPCPDFNVSVQNNLLPFLYFSAAAAAAAAACSGCISQQLHLWCGLAAAAAAAAAAPMHISIHLMVQLGCGLAAAAAAAAVAAMHIYQ
eukprot:1151652-Pelagomonas_calceolata.AAC.3